MSPKSSLENSILIAQKKVVVRFLHYGLVLMLLASMGIIFWTGLNARDVALALINSYRNQLLLGQYREPVQGFGANIPTTFSSVRYLDRSGTLVFSFPETREKDGRAWGEILFSHEIRLNEGDREPAGVVQYGISVWPSIIWCLSFYILLVMIGYPLLRMALRQSRQQVLEAVQLQRREEFSAIARQIAHDIRSPLSAITVAAYSVKSSNQKAAAMMVAASERIQKMANQLLDFSRNPQAPRPNEEEDGAHWVHGGEVLAVLHQILGEYGLKGTQIIATLPEQLPGELFLDKDVLGRIISNLLNNAIEAVELVPREGRIEVDAQHVGNMLEISVQDNGPGIAADQVELILAGQSLGKSAGNGLGVSHANRSLKSWGGRLRIESSLGQGARVILEFKVK